MGPFTQTEYIQHDRRKARRRGGWRTGLKTTEPGRGLTASAVSPHSGFQFTHLQTEQAVEGRNSTTSKMFPTFEMLDRWPVD